MKREDKFKIPRWFACSWRRVPCSRMDCKFCGKILRVHKKYAQQGKDMGELYDTHAVLRDMEHATREAQRMFREEAARHGIRTFHIGRTSDAQAPKNFLLYRKVVSWRELIYRLADIAEEEGELWIYTEAAADLFWYANTLTMATHHQLSNRFHTIRGNALPRFDHDYTKMVLEECMKILEHSLTELSLLHTREKGELIIALSELTSFEESIMTV